MPRTATKHFICSRFSTAESVNATKMATERTCYHNTKTEAKKQNLKLFFPHHFNLCDLESKVVRAADSDVTYCDLLFPNGTIKGRTSVWTFSLTFSDTNTCVIDTRSAKVPSKEA